MFTKNTISSHKVEVIKNGTGCFNGNLIVTDNDKDFDAEAKRARMTIPLPAIRVESSKVRTTDDGFMISEYAYQTTDISEDHSKGGYVVRPIEHKYTFRTDLQVPKTGLLMVGWGGNNGSTVTAGILANKFGLSWATRTGRQSANYFGSMTQSSTFRLGTVFNEKLGKFEEIYSPISSFLPTVDPNDLVLGGWDISGKNLAEAAERAQVLEPDLQRQLAPHLQTMKPLPSIFYPDFVAANQSKRADNLIEGQCKGQHLTRIRSDIRKFKEENRLGHVTVVWTATTERYCDVITGVNDTAENLLRSIDASHPEIAPSTMFAVAAILENVPFINGSPQNTCVPGVIELAGKRDVFIGGDDFKTGQTKLKSVLVDFLVGAGIKPLAITSYNHLGNNDGENLSAPQQFRSKEISKSNVVDDMVDSNRLLYSKPNERPDHVVVIKYVEAVGDSKRALDEYYSEIFMGGRSTIVVHNTCEDSLLAAPLIVDLVVLTELFSRITYKSENERNGELAANDDDDDGFQRMNCVLSILAYFLKAPLVPKGAPIVNALFRQRQALENVLRACVGLGPQNDMMLEHRCFR